MVNMNMIVNSSDLVGYEAETNKNSKNELGNAQALNQLIKIWEGKQARSGKKVAGLGLLAVTLAACNSDDDTPFAQTDIDTAVATAVAAVDKTTDNAAAVTTALTASDGTSHATVDVAITSDNATVTATATTAALTASDGTIYASVDAAHTAGVNTTSADAVTAALTSADGTVHSNVDAAIISDNATVTATATTDATAVAEASLMAPIAGFATVQELLTAYNNATATVTPTAAVLTTSADTVNGTTANDTITGTNTTFSAGDLIVDASAADSDTLTVTATDDITAAPTVAGIENINFNLNALTTTGTAGVDVVAGFATNLAGITGGVVTVDVTRASSTVAEMSVTNMGDGLTVATDLTMTAIAADANADITINATATGAQTITAQTGTADNVTVVGSGTGLLTISDLDGEEVINITSAGALLVSDLSAATDTLSSLVINSGGAVNLDTNNVGSGVITATTGTITVGETVNAMTTTLTATANAGNVDIDNAATAATSLTLTAIGDGDAAAAAADGDIIITDASVVETITANATGDIDLDDAEAAGTLVLTAGQASNLANTISDVQALTVASNSTGATAVVFTVTEGDGAENDAADGPTELDTITFTGSNSVTVDISPRDINVAEASTANATAAAAVIATDSMTGGTSQIRLSGTAPQSTIDISALAVDQIAINYDTHANDIFNVASGQTVVISADQTTEDLAFTAAAVAGNTLTISVEDDLAAGTVTGDITGITSTTISNLTLAANDPSTTAQTTGAVSVGTANTFSITGTANVNVSGAVTAGALNASGSSGNITVSATNAITAFTMGTGNDTLTSGSATALNINGGDGTDTLVLSANDYSAQTISLTSIETINVDASGVSLAGSHLTGGSYVIVGNNGQADTLAVVTTVGTGEAVDLSGTASTAKVTLTGGGGADSLTGSSTTASFFAGAAASDTIVGGAGVDTVTIVFEQSAADKITLGGGSDVILSTTAGATTLTAVEVTDFNAGTVASAVDTFTPSVQVFPNMTTIGAMSDTNDNNSANGNGTVVRITTDGQTVANADLVVLSGTYATDAAALLGMATAGADTFTMGGGVSLDANDGIMIAYYTGTHTNIAVAASAGGATSDAFDSVETIMVMQNVNNTAVLDSTDFAYIT
jgi:acrosin